MSENIITIKTTISRDTLGNDWNNKDAQDRFACLIVKTWLEELAELGHDNVDVVAVKFTDDAGDDRVNITGVDSEEAEDINAALTPVGTIWERFCNL